MRREDKLSRKEIEERLKIHRDILTFINTVTGIEGIPRHEAIGNPHEIEVLLSPKAFHKLVSYYIELERDRIKAVLQFSPEAILEQRCFHINHVTFRERDEAK